MDNSSADNVRHDHERRADCVQSAFANDAARDMGEGKGIYSVFVCGGCDVRRSPLYLGKGRGSESFMRGAVRKEVEFTARR